MEKQKSKTKNQNFKSKLFLLSALGLVVSGKSYGAILTPDYAINPGGVFGETIVEKTGNVHDIYAGKVQGDNAFNHFTEFGLDANQIANMHFNVKNGTEKDASNLFNFVDSQVRVDGTINAIKDNKIGGNLYFISASGMIVGESGVINAGSFYAVTPSVTEYATLSSTNLLSHDQVENIRTGNIQLNPEGTITVKGKINVTNNIGLHAGTINIGIIPKEGESAAATTKIILESGVTDFSSLVNITNAENNIITNSGLVINETADSDGNIIKSQTKLSAETSTDGKIILAAYADAENAIDQVFNDHLSTLVSEADNIVPRTIKAEVNIAGGIKGADDVEITATAVNGTVIREADLGVADGALTEEEEGLLGTLYMSNPLVKTEVKVNVLAGNITGNDVKIEANSKNKYYELAPVGTFGGAAAGLSLVPGLGILGLKGTLGALEGNAEVNIKNAANIEAVETVDIDANNDVSLTLGIGNSKVGSLAKRILFNSKTSSIPITAANIGYASGNAEVNIEGKVKGEKIDINAQSNNTMDITSTAMSVDPLQKTKFAFAFNMVEGENNASVNINGGEIVATKKTSNNESGQLNIGANVVNNLHSRVEILTSEDTAIVTGVNMVTYDSSTDVNINNSAIEGNEINVNSENIFEENTVITQGINGKWSPFIKKYQSAVIADTANAVSPFVKNLIGGIPGIGLMFGDGTSGIGDKITVSGSFALVGQSNHSNINIKNSQLTSTEDLNIKALTTIQDTLMSVTARTRSKAEASAGLGILYADIDNNSSVIIDNVEDNKTSTLKSTAGNVNINSSTIMEYNRVTKMIEEIISSAETLSKYLDQAFSVDENIENLKKDIEELIQEAKTLGSSLANVTSETIFSDSGLFRNESIQVDENGQTVNKDLSILLGLVTKSTEIMTKFNALGIVPTDAQQLALAGLTSTITNAIELTSLSNYANFSVQTTAADSSEEGDSASATIAGGLSSTELYNNSKVVIGKNTEIVAGKNVNISSNNEIDSINIGGNLSKYIVLPTKGGDVAIGATVMDQKFDTSSIVAIGEGVNITGTNINIDSNSDVTNVLVVASSGKTSGVGINGMVGLSRGEINNLVSIDDEVSLTAVEDSNETNEEDSGNINLATNATVNVTNIAGGLTIGGTAGVGASLALNDYDVKNQTILKNNEFINDKTEYFNLREVLNKQNDNFIKGILDTIGFLGGTGDKEPEKVISFDKNLLSGMDPKILANIFNASSFSDGMMNAIAVTGGISKTGGDGEPGLMDKLKNVTGITSVTNKVEEVEQNLVKATSMFTKENGAVSSMMNKGSGSGDSSNSLGSTTQPEVGLSGAGSVSVNLVNNKTETLIDGANIQLTGNDSKLNINAKDESFIGAWSGAAAITWSSATNGASNSFAFSGAVGLNDLERATSAKIANSEILDADLIKIESINDSVATAAGLGLSVTKASGSSGANAAVGASVSLNLIDDSTSALMEGVITKTSLPAGETEESAKPNDINIEIDAIQKGIQTTGGVNVNVGINSYAVGGAVTIADINNNIESGIRGSTLNNIDDISVDGALDMTQVTAAASIGISTGKTALQGAVVVNDLDNNINSFIEGGTINSIGKVKVSAGDSLASLDTNKHTTYLEEKGIDATGGGYYDDVELEINDGNEENDSSNSDKTINNDKNGTTIVSAAVVVSGGKNAAGAGVVVDLVENNFNSRIGYETPDTTINAKSVSVESSADTFKVGVAGGVAVASGSFGGMGSVSWSELTNNTKASINNAEINTEKLKVQGDNTSTLINTSGQIAFSTSVAAGANLVYTKVDNDTIGEINSSTINLLENSTDKSVDVVASSEMDIYSVAVGAAASTGNVSIQGTVAVADGENNTASSIEGSQINNVKALNVNAIEDNGINTVVGVLSVSSSVAVGGAGAYNEIDSQNLSATINNSDIVTSDEENEINVKAIDVSKLLTIAAGVGGSGNVAVQGSAAIANINKDITAGMFDTNINKVANQKTDLEVIADSKSEVLTSAIVLSFSGSVGIGLGVGVNLINQNVNSYIDNTKKDKIINANNVVVASKSYGNILNFGVGGAGAGSVAIAGSVSTNKIDNNVKTKINKGQVNTNGSIGAVAESDNIISNYTGVVAGAGTVAIGVATAVNIIGGETSVDVTESTLTAIGTGVGILTNSSITNEQILNNVIEDSSVDLTDNLKDKRKVETTNGIVIDSSSTNDIRALIANGGGAGTVAVNGTVNVNTIGGETRANVSGSGLNANNSDVIIRTSDYANSSGIVGSASFAGTGAGIGAASDTNVMERIVKTTINNTSTINANNINIGAIAKQGISSFGVGVGAAAVGVGVGGTVSVAKLEGETIVEINNSTLDAENDINITSDHYDSINVGSGAVGAAAKGVGAAMGISVVKNQSETRIDMNEATITAEKNIKILATNDSNLKTAVAALGAAALGAGAAGTVSVNNVENIVETNITGGEITSTSGDISVNSKNRIGTTLLNTTVGGGLVGVGAIVAVNTIESSVTTNLNDVDITASNGDISIVAEEVRNIKQSAANIALGGFALGANILINNFGTTVDKNLKTNDDGTTLEKVFENANSTQGNKFDKNTEKVLSGNGIGTTGYNVEAGYGVTSHSSEDNQGIKVNITSNSNIKASNINVLAKETDNINIEGIAGAGGVYSASGMVAHTNIERDLGINIKDSDLISKENINVDTIVDGTTAQNLYQGTAGALAIGATYGEVKITGKSNIDIIGNSELKSNNDINIKIDDISNLNVSAHGINASLSTSVGGIVTRANNISESVININNENGKIVSGDETLLSVEKNNKVGTQAYVGSAALAYSGAGADAEATDDAKLTINISEENKIIGENQLNILAKNNATLKATSGAVAGAGLVGVGGSIATAISNAVVDVNIASNNTLIGNDISIKGENIVDIDVNSIGSGGGLVGITYNEAKSENKGIVDVNVENQNYRANENDSILANLIISGLNDSTLKAETTGISAGVVASGTNKAGTNSKVTTKVTAKGGVVENADIEALTQTTINVETDGSGGGLADISPLAAESSNEVENLTELNIDGNWRTTEIDLNAMDSADVKLLADATRASVVGGSGTWTSNNIKNTTTLNINGAIKSYKELEASAKNLNKVDIDSLGSGYGGISLAGTNAKNIIVANSIINILGDVETNKDQTYEAKSDSTIDIFGKITTAGAITTSIVDINNDVTTSNNINLSEGASLKTLDMYADDVESGDSDDLITTSDRYVDINLFALDDMNLKLKGLADIPGAGGATGTTYVKNHLTENNSVVVDGSIVSMHDVNLYANKNEDARGALHAEIISEVYNGAAIPITIPKIDNEINQNNTVTVNSTGNIKSLRNIDLFSDDGTIRLEEEAVETVWYKEKDSDSKYVTSIKGQVTDKSINQNNNIEIAGELTAGFLNEQKIEINNPDGKVIILSRDTADYKDLLDYYSNIVGSPTVTGSNEITYELLIKDLMDDMSKDYEKNIKLAEEYRISNNNQAYLGYLREAERIANMGVELGIFTKDSSGNIQSNGGFEIDTIKIDEIIASGGNIEMETNNISGSGKLTANGSPKIDIINNSNLYLQIGDLTIVELGGEIKYNEISIVDGGNDRLSELNENKGLKPQFTLHTEDVNNEGNINIENTWTGDLQGEVRGSNQVHNIDVYTGIELTGNIQNLVGNVNIVTNSGSLLVNNNINAGSINMSAADSISMGYVDGVRHLGGDPISKWQGVSEKMIKDLIEDKGFADSADKTEILDPTYSSASFTPSEIISGGDIYINASDININGLVQSGYENYKLTLNSDDKSRIEFLDRNYSYSDKLYWLTKGGDNGTTRNVASWYNPYTKEIVVEEINPTGGQIYITGRISSTGSGELKALDGAADININTSLVNRDVLLRNLNNGDATGLISIAEAKGDKILITEYTKDSNKVYEMTANGTKKYLYDLAANDRYSDYHHYYSPESGLRFNWTQGSKNENGYQWVKEVKANLWREKTDEEIIGLINDPKDAVEYGDNSSKALTEGSYIGKVDSVSNSQEYQLYAQNDLDESSVERDLKEELEERSGWKNFLSFFGRDYTDKYTYTETYKSGQTFISSIKADYNIGIDFFGKEVGKIDINTGGNITLNDVTNTHTDGTVNITSKGMIEQNIDSYINSNNVIFNVGNGIEGVNIKTLSNDKLDLSAITNTGNINITTRSGLAGGISGLNINKVSSGNGEITLLTDGDIIGTPTKRALTPDVEGDRINLISEQGSINLIVQGGTEALAAANSMENSINANAKENIALTQANGDFRIGEIISEEGNVTLTINNGNLVDALPTGEKINNRSTDEKIEFWREMGLIAAEGETDKEKLSRNIEEYEAKIAENFLKYQESLKTIAGAENYYAGIDQKIESGLISEEVGTDLKENYLLNANKVKESFSEFEGYTSALSYLEANQDYKKELTETQWTANKLLYAIQESVINPETSSTQSELKNPNIVGNKVVINSLNGGVGSDGADKIINLNELYKEANLDELKALASSEAADIRWRVNEDGEISENTSDNHYALIKYKTPIGIQLKSNSAGEGSLSVSATDNIYLAARTVDNLNTENNVMYIDHIKTNDDANIRLLGTGGVYSVTEEVDFIGKDLLIEGGSQSLGTIDNPLTVKLMGSLTARTNENIFINQTGDMNIISMYAGGFVNLGATGNIFSTNEEGYGESLDGSGETDEKLILGYINAGEEIALVAGEDIGILGTGLNILNSDKNVNASGKNIYLTGRKEKAPNLGTLNLGTIDAENDVVVKNHDGVGKVKINESLIGKNATINALENIYLGGAIEITETLNMTSDTGSITQTDANTLTTDSLTASASTGIDLSKENNFINGATLANTTGDILLSNKGDNGLSLGVTKENDGSINITNETGDVILTTNVDATGNISIENTGGILGSVDVSGANVDISSTLLGKIDIENLTSTGYSNLSTKDGNIDVENIDSTGLISVIAETGNLNLGTLDSDATTTLGTTTGTINLDSLTSIGTVDISTSSDAKDKGSILFGTIDSEDTTTIKTLNGDITGTTLTSTNGIDVSVEESGDISITNLESTSGNISLTGKTSNISSTDVSGGNVDISSTLLGKIDIENLTSTGYANISTKTGNIDVDNLNSTGLISVIAEAGNLLLEKLDSGATTTLKTTTGTINLKELTSIGAVDISTSGDAKDKGSILFGTIDSEDTTTIKTLNGDITGTTLTSTNNIDVNVEKVGDISIDNITSTNGRIDVFTGDGEIASTGRIESLNSSLNMYTAKGDINFNEIYAKQDAELESGVGSLYGKYLDGENVTVIVNRREDKIDIDKILVGKKITLQTDYTKVKELFQRDGYDNDLLLAVRGTDSTKPMESFELDYVNTKNGFIIENLWSKYAKVDAVTKRFRINELSLVEKGYFSNNGVTTSVFGRDPVYDDSNFHYWYDPEVRDPWMYLEFTELDKKVDTNGRFLSAEDFFDHYDQEHSAIQQMVEQLGKQDQLGTSLKFNIPNSNLLKKYLNEDLIDSRYLYDSEEYKKLIGYIGNGLFPELYFENEGDKIALR